MTIRSSVSALATALLATIGSTPVLAQGGGGGGGGGGGQQQRPPENLQVLPKDLRRDSVVTIMRTFTGALGVQCAFCHSEREGGAPAAAAPAGGGGAGGGGAGPGGGGGPAPIPLNYALDNKEQKKAARLMLRMVDSINNVYLKMLPQHDNAVSVTCMTCHRGVSKPMTIDMVLAQAINTFGVDTAIVRYRGLRTDIAAGKYNFTEQPVTVAALRLSAAGQYDDAMRLLQMNLEFNPTSANVDNEIADVLIAKGDKDAGIARLRSILAKYPNDRRSRARLTALGVPLQP